MNWFKNLDAIPRLLLGFGVLILFIGAISYLALASRSKADDRIGTLYHDDLKGAQVADNVVLSRIWMGRQDREAMLNLDNPVIVAADKKKMLQLLADLHTDVDASDKFFHTREEMAEMDIIRKTLPPYEKSMPDLMDRIDEHDLAGATATLNLVNVVGKPLSDAGDRVQALKVARGEAEFQASNQAYQATRALLLSAAAIAMVIGVLLAVFIAHGFSLPLGRAVGVLEQVAAGDLTVTVEVLTKDEVGRMAGALNRAMERLQSIGVDQVNTAITQMDHVTQANSAQTEELASSAHVFADQASRLLELVGTFTLGHSREATRGDRGRQPAPSLARKTASSAPRKQKQLAESAVLVGSSAGRSKDASFEEF